MDQLQHALAASAPVHAPGAGLDDLIRRVCRQVGLAPAGLRAGGRHRGVARARAGIAYLWVAVSGHPARPLAALLGVSPQAVYQAVARGQRERGVWERLLKADT